MEFEILPPLGNSRGPIYTESLLRSMHVAITNRSKFSLEMSSSKASVNLAVIASDDVRKQFLQELQDAYPGSTVRRANHVAPAPVEMHVTQLYLRPECLMLRTHDQFVDLADARQLSDPISGLFAALRTGESGRLQCNISLRLTPAKPARARQAERTANRIQQGFQRAIWRRWYLVASSSPRWIFRCLGAILGVITSFGPFTCCASNKATEQLFKCLLKVSVSAPPSAKPIATRKLREIAAAFGRFANNDTRFEKTNHRRSFLLTPAEAATIWHLPTDSSDSVSRVERPSFRELEPPLCLTSKRKRIGDTVLGRVSFRQQRSLFGISTDDLRRHMIAIGKTGCGKSSFLHNVVRQQVETNRGVVLIDPHGQLANEVLESVPKHRTNDVIVFDAADDGGAIGFNPMMGPAGTDETLIADGVLTSFKHVFGIDDGSAPRLLHIFRNCLLSLIGTPQASFISVQRLLVESNFRKSVVARVKNQAVQEFWLSEFNRWNHRDRTQYIASLQNKLGAFTTNERLQRILNVDRKGLNLRTVLDEGRVLICNLSKGTVGHDASKLLGSLLISTLQIAAMSRADVAESARTDCVVVIDEFHSYLSEGNSAMADALAESRKYRTSYVLSTQMLEQLDPTTLAGVLGNCGSALCMTVGPRDAVILAELLGRGLTAEDLMRIPKFHGYMRLLIDGAPHSFSMTTLPPPKCRPNRSKFIRRVSRQRYGQVA